MAELASDMRVLILGGTRFLGRAIAAQAAAHGHQVTCAARGASGEVPAGTNLVRIDRDEPGGLSPLLGRSFDAAVDVSRHPGQVRRAAAALQPQIPHWTFVSTITVYADNRTPGQCADTAPLREPLPPEVEHATEATYGAAKVACEQALGAGALICRPGLIVGPEDPTGRFTYWPARLARGGQVLAPGTPDDPRQWIDVRDLAAWIVHAAERRLTGCYDTIGPSLDFGAFLGECAAGIGARCSFTWAGHEALQRHGVKRWAGPGSLPMWLPLPEFAGFATRDTAPARAAGLTTRPLSETARDTLDWWRSAGTPLDGMTEPEEHAILAAMRAS